MMGTGVLAEKDPQPQAKSASVSGGGGGVLRYENDGGYRLGC